MILLDEVQEASQATSISGRRAPDHHSQAVVNSTRRRANVLVADDDPASLLAMEAILSDLDQWLVYHFLFVPMTAFIRLDPTRGVAGWPEVLVTLPEPLGWRLKSWQTVW